MSPDSIIFTQIFLKTGQEKNRMTGKYEKAEFSRFGKELKVEMLLLASLCVLFVRM
jgi:hypothetical protein